MEIQEYQGKASRTMANLNSPLLDDLHMVLGMQTEVAEIADFEKELGIKFTKFKKPTSENIEENNALLWAKQIFKTKPNQDVSTDFKNKIKTVFHHLTKDELIEKLLANQMFQNKVEKEKSIK